MVTVLLTLVDVVAIKVKQKVNVITGTAYHFLSSP